MTTTSEQYLKKQVERKDAQIALLLRAFENQGVENEYLTSVACAFAWDLATGCEIGFDIGLDHMTTVPGAMKTLWGAAVKSVGG